MWKIAENTQSGNMISVFCSTLMLLLVTDLGGFRGYLQITLHDVTPQCTAVLTTLVSSF